MPLPRPEAHNLSEVKCHMADPGPQVSGEVWGLEAAPPSPVKNRPHAFLFCSIPLPLGPLFLV